MPFKRLWARMLSMFTAQFPYILRLVAIAMTFTTDTSGCERLISLMNDLQTEYQTRMEHDCLRSQMWWSTEMHRLTYSEWEAALPRMVRRWNKNRRHQFFGKHIYRLRAPLTAIDPVNPQIPSRLNPPGGD